VWVAGCAPALVLPGALDRFTLVKATAVFAALACAAMSRPSTRLARGVVPVLAAGAGVGALAALLGDSPLPQVIGRAPRFEGVLALSLYVAALVIGAWLLSAAADPRLRGHFLRASAATVALVGFVAGLEAVGLRPLSTDVARPGSLLGNATEQGVYAVGALALMLGALGRNPRDPWVLAGLSGAVVAVATSASRAAALGAVVVVLVLLLFSRGTTRRLTAIVAGVAAVLALLLPLTRSRLLLQSPLSASTIKDRTLQWELTTGLLRDRPLLGYGPSGFMDAWPGVRTQEYVQLAGTLRLDGPHSLPLQVLAATGVAGLVVVALFGLLLARGIRVGWGGDHEWTVAALAGLAGWVAALATHFTTPGTTPFFALLAGSLLGATGPAMTRLRSRVVAALAVAMTAIVALGAVAEIPLRQGIVALNRGDGEAAGSLFRTAGALRPWDADLDLAVAHAALTVPSNGFPQDLISESVRSAVGALPQDALARTDEGRYFLVTGDLDRALEAFDRALTLSPNDPQALVLRATVAARRGDLPAAVADAERAARLTPEDANALSLLASLYEQLGRTADAARVRDSIAALPTR
jgi:O-antigen ligase